MSKSSLISYHLQKIQEQSESLSTLYFKEQGMFTNAIILKPNITTLIRDSDEQEETLFKLDKETGRLDFTNRVGRSDNESVRSKEKEVNQKLNILLEQVGGKPESGEYSVGTLCEAAEKLLASYPMEGAAAHIRQLRQDWEEEMETVMHYEEIVESQKSQLDALNISLNDALAYGDRFTQAQTGQTEYKEAIKEFTIQELIEKAESEVLNLKQKLVLMDHS